MKDFKVALKIGASSLKLIVTQLGYLLSEPSFVYENNERLTGEKPEEFDESFFYKNLFRYYGIEVPRKYIEEFGEDAILKMKITYEIEKVGDAEKK